MSAALHKLEYDWNTKPLNLPAFHSLENSLNTTQLIPCRFIQSHRQSINSKLLVGSVIWFEKNLPQKKIQFFNFQKPTDDLIAQLAEYDHYFCQRKSCTRALERLYSLYKISTHPTFNHGFLQGQISHSLQCHQKQLEQEREEKKRREEEERRELKLRDTLSRRGRYAIQDWYIGTVGECIVEAEKHQYLAILKDWFKDALTIKSKIERYKIERKENIISALQRSIEFKNFYIGP